MQKIPIWDFIKYSKDEYYGLSKEHCYYELLCENVRKG